MNDARLNALELEVQHLRLQVAQFERELAQARAERDGFIQAMRVWYDQRTHGDAEGQ